MAEITPELIKALEDILNELKGIINDVKPAAKPKDRKPFFDYIRKNLFGRLTQSQVDGMIAKLDIFEKEDFPLSWKAYCLATSYHETAKRMQPVREGLNASERWRKRNLRYYPYYGRGDVQLTWEENYVRAGKELGIPDLANDPDRALEPYVSARVLAYGMRDGWFSKGHSLRNHLPNDEGTFEEFRQSRRIVNIMDRADDIAEYAMIFQQALKET